MTEHECISFTPIGEVITFVSEHMAKVVLLKQFHHYIVRDAQHLQEKYTLEQLKQVYKVTLGGNLNNHDGPVRHMNHCALALYLWPLLVVKGRDTRDVMYGKSKPLIKRAQTFVICKYKPGKDVQSDLAYGSLPTQARTIIDMSRKYLPEHGVPSHTFYKMIMDHADELKTRQNPWRVYMYYQHKLISRGLLKIES